MNLYIIAGEMSGDALGGPLIAALKPSRLHGIGGEKMQAQGLTSLFPMQELSLMGVAAILTQIPHLLKRINQTVADILVKNPDIVVMIDAQDFTKRVAAKLRKTAPHIKIMLYVAPTVWAWRPARAAKMRPFIDHILALFPFEPAVMQQLNGPPTSYVGHPLMSRGLRAEGENVLLLPGSRRSEIKHLLPVFKDVVAAFPHEKWVIPAVPHLYQSIQAEVHYNWEVKPQIVMGEEAKLTAFAQAKAAVAASGTVTLELALAHIPHLAAYKGGMIEGAIAKRLVKLPSVLLPNIILNEKIVPEFMQHDATAEKMIAALTPLLSETHERKTQLAAFEKLHVIMQTQDPPQEMAAKLVRQMATTISSI